MASTSIRGISLAAVDLQNLEERALEAHRHPMGLSAIRAGVEKTNNGHVDHVSVFVSEGYLRRKSTVQRCELEKDAEKSGVELRIVCGSRFHSNVDPVDLALIGYCQERSQELISLVLSTSDGDFVSMVTRLQDRGVYVGLAYYSRPCRALLAAVSHACQIGFDPPWIHQKKKYYCR